MKITIRLVGRTPGGPDVVYFTHQMRGDKTQADQVTVIKELERRIAVQATYGVSPNGMITIALPTSVLSSSVVQNIGAAVLAVVDA